MREEPVQLGGVELLLRRGGDGPTVLFLHGEDGLLFSQPLLDQLTAHAHVVAPAHPGWGSPRPEWMRTFDDLAYVYLDLLEHLGGPVVVVGASMGGWLAAEVATKDRSAIAGLVLAAPLGIKTTDRRTRGFVDVWATPPADVRSALYADPARMPDLLALTDDQLVTLATAQEAVARFGWEPYLHNPQLRSRLRRLRVPTTLLAGDQDAFVLDPHYWEAYRDAIGDHATLVRVPGAGHRLEEEAPGAIVAATADLLSRAAVPAGVEGGGC